MSARVIRWYKTNDEGIQQWLSDLREKIEFCKGKKQWRAMMEPTLQEIEYIEGNKASWLGDKVREIPNSLETDLLITDIFDSTGLGQIIHRGSPWTDIRPNDELVAK